MNLSSQQQFSVYKITNNVNGKIYIGYTKHSPEVRLQQHLRISRYASSTTALTHAIRKHGDRSFSVETIEQYESKEIALEMEKKYIAELGSAGNTGGYNETFGGEGGGSLTDAARLKRNAACRGRKFTQEHKDKIGKGHRVPLPEQEIIALYEEGFGVPSICKKLGLKKTTVSRRLKLLGVRTRSISDAQILVARRMAETRSADSRGF